MFKALNYAFGGRPDPFGDLPGAFSGLPDAFGGLPVDTAPVSVIIAIKMFQTKMTRNEITSIEIRRIIKNNI